MLTVFILASHADERHVKEFWTHTALLRRQIVGITWSTVYIEDMANSRAVVPVQQDPYIVIGCLSNVFLSALLDEPAMREVIAGARRKIPFILSPCGWDEYPSPFKDKAPLIRKAIAGQGNQKDALLTEAIGRLRPVLVKVVGEI